MPLAKDNLSTNANGGTEMMKNAIISRLPTELTDQFKIFVSRVQEPIDPNKINIYWAHDLPQDPAAEAALGDNRWQNFDALVFVSMWQQSGFQARYNIPYFKCTTLCNAIEPFEIIGKPDPKENVNLIYHTTPHRGLEILVPVFEKLVETDDNVTLDVYSSFDIYGWPERNKPYEPLFERCKNHPKINYHGYQPNDVVRKALDRSHIYAYPSIWLETSCISLIEAMSSRNLCVHSNLGALWDTGGGLTRMYSYDEDNNMHANRFLANLVNAIDHVRSKDLEGELTYIKNYADSRFNLKNMSVQWENFLRNLIYLKENNALNNRDAVKTPSRFVYRT
jgi:glycosyltransferase involved in cell wall biosynthesis